MGREAIVHAVVGDAAGEVKAMLESDALILRGTLRHRFARAEMDDVRAEEGALRFGHVGVTVALHLGDAVAARWAEAIRRPPPDLRAKLDLKGQALWIGDCDDAALATALAGMLTDQVAEASVIVARIDCAADVDAALRVSARLPIWAVYRKGKAAAFGDSAVRQALRAAGYRDSKSCAVSDRLTATRYHPPA